MGIIGLLALPPFNFLLNQPLSMMHDVQLLKKICKNSHVCYVLVSFLLQNLFLTVRLNYHYVCTPVFIDLSVLFRFDLPVPHHYFLINCLSNQCVSTT